MKKYLLLPTLLLLFTGCGDNAPKEIPPLPLPVITVSSSSVSEEIEFVGQVYGFLDIPIRARVDGYLEKIHFEEGSLVEKGQPLYSIDVQTYRERVATQQSSVAQAQTNVAKAKSDLDRIKPLAAINAVSQAELDGAIAAYEASVAALDAANANLQIARIDLSYTQIKSPINGLIGKSEAQIGEYVGRDPNPVILNTVSLTDSVKVEFFITESDYLELARNSILALERGEQKVSEGSTLELVLSDNSVFREKGKFRFANREIDPTTGSLLIQTVFPNPQNFIKPGQFVKVRITTPAKANTIIVPQRAVKEFQGNYSVFVVSDGNNVEERKIELGPEYRDYYVVKSGLKNGERVVLEGLLKVKSGQVIDPQMTEFQSKVVD
ncbi:MAG: efflux RND transporter periplasmic adaptor subunit [Cyclobacteriaceae bacterium]